MTPNEVKRYFGTQANIAKALGCEQSSVSEWFANGYIPEGRQYQIELGTQSFLRADKAPFRVPVQVLWNVKR